MKNGWIRLHRSIIEWEWYKEPKVFQVFLHCLLSANHKDKKWMGNLIKKGSLITSYQHLADNTHLSVQEVRTVLNKLKLTGELTVKTTNKYSIVTVCNYEAYQDSSNRNNTPTNKQLTNKQQTTNNQLTTNNNDKNVKNVNKRAVPHFEKWLDYRKELKKPITVKATLVSLVRRFNSESIERIKWVVEHSIQNGYQGLFWDKYKEKTPLKPKKRINHYDYECLNCNKLFHKREIKGDDDFDAYRCDENGCQTVGLGKDGKNMVGVQLKFIKAVYKE